MVIIIMVWIYGGNSWVGLVQWCMHIWSKDIIGVALDLDNNKLYFSKNGTWQISLDPTSGSTGTGAVQFKSPLEHQVTCLYH